MVQVKMEVKAVKLVAVWVGVVCAESFALSNGSHFAERPFRALPHPLAEVKSKGYSLVPYFLRSCRFFHFT